MCPEAFLVGSSPNGLAATITLARAGHWVRGHEANEAVGGGLRSTELTVPRYLHEVQADLRQEIEVGAFTRDTTRGVRDSRTRGGADRGKVMLPVEGQEPLDRGENQAAGVRSSVLQRFAGIVGGRLRLLSPVDHPLETLDADAESLLSGRDSRAWLFQASVLPSALLTFVGEIVNH